MFLSNKPPTKPLPRFQTNTPLDSTFDKDIRDTHLIYDYDAEDADGKPEKWRYEMWFFSEDRIVYAIHGGPMSGRVNYQTATYQCIRPGELWQVNWLEETGTVCSLVYDIPKQKISTLISFSRGIGRTLWRRTVTSATREILRDGGFWQGSGTRLIGLCCLSRQILLKISKEEGVSNQLKRMR
ncbi:phenol acid decarboxylase [Colletotrichum tofieldiae]|nr:phenol acid decarboxylase [Colletotrichum tofieldiae]